MAMNNTIKQSNMNNSKGKSLSIINGAIWINGELIENVPKGMNKNRVDTINNRVYIGGYEYIPEEKSFKRTLTALWYYWF